MGQIAVEHIQCSYKNYQFEIKEIIDLFKQLKNDHLPFIDQIYDLNEIVGNTIIYHAENNREELFTVYHMRLYELLPTDLAQYYLFKINLLIERLLDIVSYSLKSISIVDYFIEGKRLCVRTAHYNYFRTDNYDDINHSY